MTPTACPTSRRTRVMRSPVLDGRERDRFWKAAAASSPKSPEQAVLLHCGKRDGMGLECAPVSSRTSARAPHRASPEDRGRHGFEIKRVGVIGAGQMGNGIAHVCADRRLRRLPLNDMRRPSGSSWDWRDDQRQHDASGQQEPDHRGRSSPPLAWITAAENLDALAGLADLSDRRPRLEKRAGQAQDLPAAPVRF